MYCVGIGSALSGRPADLLIIDDPVKDRADAESVKMRDRAWDWWESVALERLGPDARAVLIQTRWHENDLGGRILARPSSLDWKVVKISRDRRSERYARPGAGRGAGQRPRGKPGHFLNLRATMSPYTFSSIYQQTPTAAEGNFFRRQTFRYWRSMSSWTDGRERIDLEGRV